MTPIQPVSGLWISMDAIGERFLRLCRVADTSAELLFLLLTRKQPINRFAEFAADGQQYRCAADKSRCTPPQFFVPSTEVCSTFIFF
jgi:hypothetical protein